ncbi:MAG: hypothetical protein LBK26_02835 [Rickettsiales bacterium]|jgi:hypothetical protein|nr:hypothetical protein [Rickettsiales bacterium]
MKFLKFVLCSLLIVPFAHCANADPVPQYAPADAVYLATPSPRSGAVTRGTAGNSGATVSRGTTASAPRGGAASRSVTTRAGGTAVRSDTSRSVVTRAGVAGTPARAVRARVGVTGQAAPAGRVGVTGTPTTRASTTSVTSLYNRLYTGNYSTIVDPNTGLISADAYSNCLESYYTCMDEICTVRNPGQRRCACAGRIKTFANTELQLQSAREDLLRISGELALFIAAKGKGEAIKSAFTLTEAEKVLNCVSWRDLVKSGASPEQKTEWCNAHLMEDNCSGPTYCSSTELGLGGSGWMDTLSGSDSDIIAALQSYAKEIDNINTLTVSNTGAIEESMQSVNKILNASGVGAIVDMTDGKIKDSLMNTWGYDLFAYAHNNVCNRVLNSCFNGIYETCGTPSNSEACPNGQTQCPFNYNSIIKTDNTGAANIEFVKPGDKSYQASGSAACYGYASTYDTTRGLTNVSSDPYSSLRVPVADARRSVLQKYLLDANADCDTYGEELRKQVQNVQYQKIAATQALQQKRLQFQQEEEGAAFNNFATAKSNFSQCLSDLYDCYIEQTRNNANWSTARIKTYCQLSSNVPSCYDQMICMSPQSQLQAVVDAPDKTDCLNSSDVKTNNCRNIVTLTEILNPVVGSNAGGNQNANSAWLREQCLQKLSIDSVRNWKKTDSGEDWNDNPATPSCASGTHNEGGVCVSNVKDCGGNIQNSLTATQNWNASNASYDACVLHACNTGYHKIGDACESNTRNCSPMPANATACANSWINGAWGPNVVTACGDGKTVNADNSGCE